MSLAKTAVSAAALILVSGVSIAYAEDQPANTFGCMHMDKEVRTALNASGQSPNAGAAKDELQMGRNACQLAYYKIGLEHFKKALELLAHG